MLASLTPALVALQQVNGIEALLVLLLPLLAWAIPVWLLARILVRLGAIQAVLERDR